MKGTYDLNDLDRAYMKDIIVAVVEYIINHKETDGVSLNPIDVSPSQVISILEELGYKEYSSETTGWEGDSWWHFIKDDNPKITEIVLYYCGYTFDMTLSLEEE